MKKNKFNFFFRGGGRLLFGVISLACITAILGYIGCTRDKQIDRSNLQSGITAQNNTSTLFNSAPASDAEKLKARIHLFRDRIKDLKVGAAERNDENMEVQDVKWNIEALLNATYANASLPYSKYSEETNTFSVPVTNNVVAANSLLLAYEMAQNYLSQHYYGLTSDFKNPVLIDVEVASITASSVNLKMTTIIATDNLNGPEMNCNVFTPMDYWYCNAGRGTCCGNPGNFGLDAADVLRNAINLRYPLGTLQNHSYFTDIEDIEINPLHDKPFDIINPNDVTPFDDKRDYLVFATRVNSMPQTECINPVDMNWYYCNIYNIITQATPSGKGFINLSFFDDVVTSGGNYRIFHRGHIKYGKSVQCPCPPCPPNVPVSDCNCC